MSTQITPDEEKNESMNEKIFGLLLKILEQELYPEIEQTDEELLENVFDYADMPEEKEVPEYVKNSAIVLLLRHFDAIKLKILNDKYID
ncbi:MAG: hypothetical protein QXT25_03285 [Candidatus Anstonellaceae archaeon]